MRPLLILALTSALSASCGAATVSATRTTPPGALDVPPSLAALPPLPDAPLRYRPNRTRHRLRLPPRPAQP